MSQSFEKPTIEQTAWVISCILINAEAKGSFRYLIYDIMDYGPEAYQPLYIAGGMTITNALFDFEEKENLI
jgi:hypothetical protein